jgi:hypothetical protein
MYQQVPVHSVLTKRANMQYANLVIQLSDAHTKGNG